MIALEGIEIANAVRELARAVGSLRQLAKTTQIDDEASVDAQLLASAIGRIASGSNGPDGLEGVAMALGGTGLHGSVAASLEDVARNISVAIDRLGGPLEKLGDLAADGSQVLRHLFPQAFEAKL